MVLVVGFLINSLFEELFYRVWLQTRLEGLLGTWPAIMLTSIVKYEYADGMVGILTGIYS
jgi:uncharacterized protein